MSENPSQTVQNVDYESFAAECNDYLQQFCRYLKLQVNSLDFLKLPAAAAACMNIYSDPTTSASIRLQAEAILRDKGITVTPYSEDQGISFLVPSQSELIRMPSIKRSVCSREQLAMLPNLYFLFSDNRDFVVGKSDILPRSKFKWREALSPLMPGTVILALLILTNLPVWIGIIPLLIGLFLMYGYTGIIQEQQTLARNGQLLQAQVITCTDGWKDHRGFLRPFKRYKKSVTYAVILPTGESWFGAGWVAYKTDQPEQLGNPGQFLALLYDPDKNLIEIL